MKIKKWILGDYQVNTYLIVSNNSAMLIDPGYESKEIINYIKDNNLNLEMIVMTHEHPDHIGAANFYKKTFNKAMTIISKDAIQLLDKNVFPSACNKSLIVNYYVDGNEVLKLNELSFQLIKTPGHSPGGISLYLKGFLFSGDTLFKNSIGRYDFYLGDFDTLKESVLKLYKLPPETVVYPGHGEKTTIGYERKHNAFIRI
ncbi:MAG: MBL fold metallo-hydrolase [Acholeplasmataceae bacterium]|jgi:glyoxylase-like metal-dependent hydrolase (beta-lactamase superfamily II)|nr:MBL fold metallo-hydrolase [Acholeplasmataceae bacterium]